MSHVHNAINRLAAKGIGLTAPTRETGQTLVEYAFVLVLIAIVVVGVLTFLGGQIGSVFGQAADAL